MSAILGGAAIPLMTAPLLAFVPVPTLPRPIDFTYLLVLGAIMSATNCVLYFRLVSTIGATKSISVEFAVTGIALLIGGVLLHERFSAIQIAGTASIIIGCMLVLELLPLRRAWAVRESPLGETHTKSLASLFAPLTAGFVAGDYRAAPIPATCGLADAREAHRKVAAGSAGRIVLRPQP